MNVTLTCQEKQSFASEDMEITIHDQGSKSTEQVLIEICGFGKKREQESTYLIAADVARGDGKDYSVCHVIKLETMEL